MCLLHLAELSLLSPSMSAATDLKGETAALFDVAHSGWSTVRPNFTADAAWRHARLGDMSVDTLIAQGRWSHATVASLSLCVSST